LLFLVFYIYALRIPLRLFDWSRLISRYRRDYRPKLNATLAGRVIHVSRLTSHTQLIIADLQVKSWCPYEAAVRQ